MWARLPHSSRAVRFALPAIAVAVLGAAPADPFAGRVAVQSDRCLTQFGNEPLKILDDRTLLYSPVGKRIWRNDLPERCPGLDPDDVLVIEPLAGAQLCEGDRFRSIDRGSHIPGPTCRLGRFTAYERR